MSMYIYCIALYLHYFVFCNNLACVGCQCQCKSLPREFMDSVEVRGSLEVIFGVFIAFKHL